MVTLGSMIGTNSEEEFVNFDLTEIQEVLQALANTKPIDIAHAEVLQQKSLRGADILTEYLGKIIKTIGYLESKVSSTKNRVSLEYNASEGKTTADMKKWAGECSPEVEELQVKLAKAKASKLVLEKKYDLLIRGHHFWKDLTTGMRKSILGYSIPTTDSPPETGEAIVKSWGQ